MNRRLRNGLMAAVVAVGLTVAAGCSGPPASQAKSQSLTEQISSAATDPAQGGVAYPLAEMKSGGWMEEKMLAEHLRRQANPNATRYITLVTQMGQVMGSYPMQGMVFDPNAQMTTQDLINYCQNCSSSGQVTRAPGDNGTYGPEAGAAAFFTTSGAEIQIPVGMIWVESDVPLGLTTAPLLTYNQSAQPTVNGGGVRMGGK